MSDAVWWMLAVAGVIIAPLALAHAYRILDVGFREAWRVVGWLLLSVLAQRFVSEPGQISPLLCGMMSFVIFHVLAHVAMQTWVRWVFRSGDH